VAASEGATPAAAPPAGRPSRLRAGLLIGRFYGVPVIVSPSWLLFVAWITVQFAPFVGDQVAGIGNTRYLVSLAFGVFLGISVLAHELGHTAAARYFGVQVEKIWLTFLAGHTAFSTEPGSPGRMFVIAGAGPLTNGAVAVAAAFGAHAVSPHTVGSVVLTGLAWTNGVVALYNLLPGLPLDGGQLLRSVIWRATNNQRTGTIGAAWSGRALSVATALLGLYWFTRHSSPARVDAIWLLIISAMTWASSSSVLQQQALRDRLPNLSARALTRRALAVTADLPLGEAVRRAQEVQARALFVIDAAGRATAVVSEAAVTATPVERRPWVATSAVSRAVDPAEFVPAQLVGEDLLLFLQRVPATEYLVVEPGGAVYGVLAATDVAQVLRG
jgi:Zn-dependent protease